MNTNENDEKYLTEYWGNYYYYEIFPEKNS